MTVFAQNRAPDFRLKRNVVVFAAVVADDFKASRRVPRADGCRFFRAAFLTSLRRGHIALVKSFLFLFGKYKIFAALHARNFYVGHRVFSPCLMCGKFNRKIFGVATLLNN